MTNGSKFEQRKQINRALKPWGVRILNLSRTLYSQKVPQRYLKYIFFHIYSDIQDSLMFISRVVPTPKFRSIDVIMDYVIYFHQVDFTLLPIASVVVGAEVSNLT